MARVALTFDDGPAEWTEPILDVLAAYDACVTFFVIGSLAQDRDEILRRIVADGHEVGNHTWSHPWLARDCDDQRVHDELERTNLLLAELVGSRPHRFRAPHYDIDARVTAIAGRLRLTHTRGDVTPPDWDERCTQGFITTFVLQQARDGAVVGLHDGVAPTRRSSSASRRATVDAVATIVPRLLDRGFECVTATALLGVDEGA